MLVTFCNIVLIPLFSLAPILYLVQCFSTFLLQRNLAQIFALLIEPYAMMQVSILLQLHRTVVANLAQDKFGLGLFQRNPWQSLAEP